MDDMHVWNVCRRVYCTFETLWILYNHEVKFCLNGSNLNLNLLNMSF